jgi:hypothetical protein
MTVILSRPSLASDAARKVADCRAHLQDAIRAHEAQAQQAAQQGDVAGAARCILAALDAERRMAGSGPQVLQVIKPRD